MNTVVEAQATTATGSGVEQGTTPYLEGSKAVAMIVPSGFSGTAILEGSDDNSTWSTLKTTGSLTTSDVPVMAEVTLKKYLRSNVTRSAGTVSIYTLNAN
tara:strand:+ start:1386 stop:1685 length:300 start_codon:yes stop_codon:yes gene_type:complete